MYRINDQQGKYSDSIKKIAEETLGTDTFFERKILYRGILSVKKQ